MGKHPTETSWETEDRSADPSAFVSYLRRLDEAAAAASGSFRLQVAGRLCIGRKAAV